MTDLHDEAQAIKKRTVNKMIWVTMGGLKRAFLLWHQEAKALNELRKVRSLLGAADILGSVASESLLPLLDYKGQRRKERVLLRFIENANLNTRDAFDRWRNFNQVSRMRAKLSGEKKRALLGFLQRFMTGNRHNLLRVLLQRFFHNSRMSGIQTRFFARLMATSTGAFIDSFTKWKALPEPKNLDSFRKGSRFEKSLSHLLHNKLKMYFF